MPTGWETLGNVLGGGVDTAGAYETGRLRTAQTENALIQARNRQLEGVSLEAKNKARAEAENTLVKSGKYTPEEAKLVANIMNGETGTDFANANLGMQRNQEMGFRDTLADPNAPLGEQFAAGQGVQGKMLNPYDMMGAGDFVDMRARPAPGEMPGLGTTPLGESMIDENEASAAAAGALTGLRNVQSGDPDYHTVGGGGAAGGKAPSGYIANPDYDPTRPQGPDNPMVVPMAGGPADPSAPLKLGVRERQVISRVFTAATNTAKDLENIMMMPSGASSGYLGSGVAATPGTNLLSAGWSDLKNRVSREETDIYNATLGGLSNQLMTLERQGMQGTGALEAQYDRLALVPTDTVQQKMYKLALIRQTVESALESNIAMGTVSGDLLTYAQRLQAQVARAVPFTPNDVIKLVNSGQRGGQTLGQITAARSGAAPAPGGAPAAPGGAPAAPSGTPGTADADGWIDLGGGVRIREKPNASF